MENLHRSKEYLSVVQNGFRKSTEEDVLTAQKKVVDEARLKDLKAKNYLFSLIDKTILKTIIHKKTSK